MTLTISIEPDFQVKLEQIAQSIGKSTEEVVIEAINEHLERLNRQKLEIEQQAYEQMYSKLKKKYLGQFVAIHNKELVGTGQDFESLFLRIQESFGDVPILICQVTESPVQEWRFRSPRLERAL
jgi:hypothetical protein